MSLDYLTASFNPLPALNLGTVFAGILMLAPVCGFLPILAFLLETVKVPKPVKTTSLPAFKLFCTSSKIVFKQSPAHFLEQSTDLTMALTMSSFVTFAIFLYFSQDDLLIFYLFYYITTILRILQPLSP